MYSPSTVTIKDRVWYFRLYNVDSTKGLFNWYPLDTIQGKLLVQYESPSHYTSAKRVYSLFQDIADYLSYVKKFPEEDRCFYETIIGQFQQKPHFDIDFEGTDEEEVKVRSNTLLLNLCNGMARILSRHNISIRRENILIYTSHGKKKEGYKRSFHLLLDGYYHHNNIEAGAFYAEVMKELYTTPDREHIDHAVYGSVQQFRLLGSRKYGSGRTKIPQCGLKDDMTYFEEIALLRKSIVTDCGDCVALPFFVQSVANSYSRDETVLTGDEIAQIEELVASHNFTRDCSSIREISGGLVILKREQESVCPNCNRTHEAENPFLTVAKSGDVRFHCRRGEDTTIMGRIHRVTAVEETQELETTEEVTAPPPIVTLPPMRNIDMLSYSRARLGVYKNLLPRD